MLDTNYSFKFNLLLYKNFVLFCLCNVFAFDIVPMFFCVGIGKINKTFIKKKLEKIPSRHNHIDVSYRTKRNNNCCEKYECMKK